MPPPNSTERMQEVVRAADAFTQASSAINRAAVSLDEALGAMRRLGMDGGGLENEIEALRKASAGLDVLVRQLRGRR